MVYVYERNEGVYLKSLALRGGQLRIERLNDFLKVARTDFMSEVKLKSTSFYKDIPLEMGTNFVN